ncbi:hypothetical protein CL673_08580 [Candidatus Bathyarchaeota archaeon]|jgi:hypothetical protein|nr:hypothetical protein [Candidatus Bathyarchaeota archaeon]MDP6048251.1 hypothetical protein [Candidatus Bathyarchaeota archaeon]MDP7443746.1 hypothetical protein [Candidatus Bathyarchaeota archaeon]|tara:strand:- start:794 stop:1135 length:342 start_codon:yes stop_codon:yes gene_type:complete
MKDELKKDLEESKRVLESYKWYGQMVTDAINALEEVERYLIYPSEERQVQVKEILVQMKNQIGPYKDFVPQVVRTVDKVLEWLSTPKNSLEKAGVTLDSHERDIDKKDKNTEI